MKNTSTPLTRQALRLAFILQLLITITVAGAQPAISSFSPASGGISNLVTITGTNFSAVSPNNVVYFGAVKAKVLHATTTSLTVAVPAGATYQPLSVTINGLTGWSNTGFIVTYDAGTDILSANSYTEVNRLNAVEYLQSTVAKDFDGDGKTDIAATTWLKDLFVFRNTHVNDIVSFAPKVDFGTNGFTGKIVSEDLDGDGKPDVAIIKNFNLPSPFITVLKNNSVPGTMAFADGLQLPVTKRPTDIAIADIDKDGRPDMLVTITNDTARKVSVFLNTSSPGAISFAPRIDLPISIFPQGIIAKDFDLDGLPDLVIRSFSDSLLVYRNTSSGGGISFQAAYSIFTNGSISSMYTADIDGDTRPEILLITQSPDSLLVLKNTGTPGNISFDASGVSAPKFSNIITVDDINGDGKVDVVLGSQGIDSFETLLNKSTGANIVFGDGIANSAVTGGGIAGDFNGDGQPDIAINAFNDQVVIFKNQVNKATIKSFTPVKAATGTEITINGRHFINVTGVSFGGTPAASYTVVSSGIIKAIVGAGSSGKVTVSTATHGIGEKEALTFVPQSEIISFSPTTGIPGTVVIIKGRRFSPLPAADIVYFGAVKAPVTAATDTTLTVVVPVSATYSPISVTTGYLTATSPRLFNITFEGTGHLDSLSFKNKTNFANSGCSNIASGDIDGDGKPDMVTTNYTTHTLAAFRNTSTGGALAFDTAVNFDNNVGGQPVLKDIDGDGKLDVVTDDGGIILVYRNISLPGHISFEAGKAYDAGVSTSGMDVGDIDFDGKPDIIVTSSYDGVYVIFKNTGTFANISFTKMPPVDVTGFLHTPYLVDVDKDGMLDVIMQVNGSQVDGDDYVTVYKNTSDATGIHLNGIWGTVAVKWASGIAVGDINRDGNTDFALTNGEDIQVAKNYGNGTFLPDKYLHMQHGIDGYIAIADVNGDSIPDIISTEYRNNDSSLVSVFQNRSNLSTLTFDDRISYFGGARVHGFIIEDFDGDGRPDIAFADPNEDAFTILRNIATILPVNLLSFNGAPLGKINRLYWQTATEKNTASFVVERASANMRYLQIGKVAAAKNSSTLQDYTFTDGAPLSIENYYRLKIVDADGRYTYSNTIKIVAGAAPHKFLIFPNPAVNFITIQHPVASGSVITVTDIGGKIIRVLKPAGNATQSSLALTGLAKGIYKVVWHNGQQQYSESVLVQ